MPHTRVVQKTIYFLSILIVAALWALPATAYEEEIFPASIKVTASPAIINQMVRHDYPVDMIDGDTACLYVTEKEYRKLTLEFARELETGAAAVSIVQTRAAAKAIIARKYDVYALQYHSYQSMLTELEALQSRHPDIVRIYNLGTVSDGRRSMWAVKISDHVAIEEDEPLTLLTGGIHGNEMPGPELALYIINHILNNRTDGSIQKLIDETQLWFVPMINPYGHENGTRGNAAGMDLNRNFPTSWATQSAGDLNREVETNILVSFFDEHPHILAGIDYHTYGSMYMRVWAHTRQNPADYDAINDLCTRMGSAAGYRTGSILNLVGSVSGGSADYYYGAYGDFHYGVELGRSHTPPAAQLEPLCEQNLESALLLLNRVHHSVVTGHITANGQPVVAEVRVDGIDTSRNIRRAYESDADFGRYYRMLMPGTYNMTFVCNGEQVTKTGVSVTANGVTTLDVAFDAGTQPTPDPDPDPNPNPGGCDGGSGGNPGGCGE